jgi:transposase InsO family protein
MPWEETTYMEQRTRFVEALKSGLYTVTQLCRHYGISRKSAYKWLQRYEQEGESGLKDRCRAPKTSPSRTTQSVTQSLLALRQAHPTWGPRKLLAYLHKKDPHSPWPALSTAGDILKRHGLVEPSRRRSRVYLKPKRALTQATAPNEVWTCDFKGQFRTADGWLCFPLTVTDGFSRYLLGVEGLDNISEQQSWPVFERLFRTYGLPQVIRSDNGSPFASVQSLAGLSHLSVQWIKLGIVPERIQPGRPGQNGSHERMHRDLKQETLWPPATDRAAQQSRFDQFRQIRNVQRPHQALADKTPAEIYHSSSRPYPVKIEEPDYPAHFEVRSVHRKGEIKFRGRVLFLSEALRGQRIGLEEFEDGRWSLFFAQVLLGRLHERDFRIYGLD